MRIKQATLTCLINEYARLTFFKNFEDNFFVLKFIYSGKATKFLEISTVKLRVTTQDKSTVEILQNFVAFSEYMNFKGNFFRKFDPSVLACLFITQTGQSILAFKNNKFIDCFFEKLVKKTVHHTCSTSWANTQHSIHFNFYSEQDFGTNEPLTS